LIGTISTIILRVKNHQNLNYMAPEEKVRKPRAGHKPYNRPLKPHVPKAKAPKTSAVVQQSQKHIHQYLTLHDWLTVVAYFDGHQPISQDDVVKHFANNKDGILIFTQCSLSRHLSEKGRMEDKRRLEATPTALSSKRARIVTRPDVEAALFKWVKHMEEKGEHVSGAMLMVKREKFEEALDVPEEARLKTGGWVTNFCRV
jgi:hypothetical protein